MNVIERFNRDLTPIIERLGYEVVDVEYKKIGKDNNLTVYIYKKGGVTLDDCEAVNNALDAPLDTLDITEGQKYILNISSPGLDRPIVTDKDLERSLDTEIEVFFKDEKKKKTAGTLTAYDDTSVTLLTKGKTAAFDRAEIKLMRPLIKFK